MIIDMLCLVFHRTLERKARVFGGHIENINWEQGSGIHITGYTPYHKMLINLQQSVRSKRTFKNYLNTLSLFFSFYMTM